MIDPTGKIQIPLVVDYWTGGRWVDQNVVHFTPYGYNIDADDVIGSDRISCDSRIWDNKHKLV